MSDPAAPQNSSPDSAHGEYQSALFANLVLQQSEMALMLMGKVPHPESGQTVRELERARLLIDQLEMLDQKTRGNLTKDEAGLLKQSLMSLRMAFVEAVDAPTASPSDEAQKSPSAPALAETEAESRKRFSKKY